MDDGIIFAQCISGAALVISYLKQCFNVKIEETEMFVGKQIYRDRVSKSIFFHPEAYACKITEKFQVLHAPCNMHANPNTILCALKTTC